MKLFKYAIVGIIGTIVHFLTLIAFVEIYNFTPVVSSVLGFLIVLIISYFLNKYWTFQTKTKDYKEFLKYIVVSCTGLLINSMIMYIIVNLLRGNYLLGQGIVTLVIPVTNYLLNNSWTFSKIHNSKEDY